MTKVTARIHMHYVPRFFKLQFMFNIYIPDMRNRYSIFCYFLNGICISFQKSIVIVLGEKHAKVQKESLLHIWNWLCSVIQWTCLRRKTFKLLTSIIHDWASSIIQTERIQRIKYTVKANPLKFFYII